MYLTPFQNSLTKHVYCHGQMERVITDNVDAVIFNGPRIYRITALRSDYTERECERVQVNTNVNATSEQFCHSNRARTRTRKTVEAFETVRLFLAVRDQVCSFGIMAQVVRQGEDNSFVFVRKAILISNLGLRCHTVHNSPQFKNHGFRLVHCHVHSFTKWTDSST